MNAHGRQSIDQSEASAFCRDVRCDDTNQPGDKAKVLSQNQCAKSLSLLDYSESEK